MKTIQAIRVVQIILRNIKQTSKEQFCPRAFLPIFFCPPFIVDLRERTVLLSKNLSHSQNLAIRQVTGVRTAVWRYRPTVLPWNKGLQRPGAARTANRSSRQTFLSGWIFKTEWRTIHKLAPRISSQFQQKTVLLHTHKNWVCLNFRSTGRPWRRSWSYHCDSSCILFRR